MSAPEGENGETSRFTFGSMALAEEPGRGGAPSHSTGLLAGQAMSQGGSHLDSDGSSSNETVEILSNIVQNEQFSPELLPFETEKVESVHSIIKTQTELVDAEEDDEQVDQLSFESQLKRMELDRINYQLRQYYRLRIKKIERFIMHLFTPDGGFDLLSEKEQEYAATYKNLVDDHFKKSFLHMLPPRLQIIEKDGQVSHATPPPLDTFVFCRVRNNVGPYVIGEDATDDSLDLNRGDVVCIRYKGIRELLKKSDVELL